MGRKRKSGKGTVRLRKDGRWEGRVVIGYDEKGLPKTKSVLAKTKAECVEKLESLKAAVTPATATKLRADMPFGEWVTFWYENYSKPTIRPNTQRNYELYIQQSICPQIGHIPLNKLTTGDIQQMCIWMKTNGGSGKGLSDSRVVNCRSLCHRALAKAVQENLIPRDPTVGCKIPPAERKEMKVLSREEMQRVLIQAKEEGYYELFLLEFATGLREGELLGLQWDDLNLKTGELRVNKQVVMVGSELTICEPKTKAAVRTLILPPAVRKVLAEYKTRVDSRWLFPSPKTEDMPLRPFVAYQRLQGLLERTGCESIRFHDLRHTFATNALAYGMDIKTLSTILGHVSSATTLNTYSHITDEMRQAAAAKIDQGIAKAEPKGETAPKTKERIMTTFQAQKRWQRKAS